MPAKGWLRAVFLKKTMFGVNFGLVKGGRLVLYMGALLGRGTVGLGCSLYTLHSAHAGKCLITTDRGVSEHR